MAIEIKMYGKKWRLKISTEEEFEFETKDEMNSILQSILTYKEKYGDLKK
jgi:hypothetical protein